jgi:hypothetical protein
MTQTLLPRMVRHSLLPLQESLQREGQGYTPEDVWEMVQACELLAFEVAVLWRMITRLLDDGTEGRKLAFFLKETQDSVEAALGTFAKVREVTLRTAPNGASADLALLERAAGRAQEVRAKIASLLDWLETSPPKVDLAALTARAEQARPEDYERLEPELISVPVQSFLPER